MSRKRLKQPAVRTSRGFAPGQSGGPSVALAKRDGRQLKLVEVSLAPAVQVAQSPDTVREALPAASAIVLYGLLFLGDVES